MWGSTVPDQGREEADPFSSLSDAPLRDEGVHEGLCTSLPVSCWVAGVDGLR